MTTDTTGAAQDSSKNERCINCKPPGIKHIRSDHTADGKACWGCDCTDYQAQDSSQGDAELREQSIYEIVHKYPLDGVDMRDLTRKLAAYVQAEVRRARIDELQHTLPFGKYSRLYQRRSAVLEAGFGEGGKS